MKKLSILLFIAVSFLYKGQIGVGTTTPNSAALLDIDVTTITPKKGFLLPRVNLLNNSDTSTILSPSAGMIVYNKTTAGTGNNIIKANTLAVWDSNQWQSISSLPEILALKTAKEFVMASLNGQNFTSTGELAAVNSSVPVVVSLTPGDVFIPNVNDIQLNGNSLKFLTDSYYQISGLLNFKVNTLPTTSASQVVLALQSSIDNGANWSSIFGNSLPIERLAAGKTQTIATPNFIHHFSVNELLRIVIYKPATATNYPQDSGIIVNQPNLDITKSFRIVRIQQ
jgi:hypothetical protein